MGSRARAAAGCAAALLLTASCAGEVERAVGAVEVEPAAGAVDLEVLSVRTWQSGGLALTDLATGETRLFAQGERGMTSDPIDGAALTPDGTVVFWQDGVVTALRSEDTEPLLVHRPERLATPDYIAPALTVHSTPDGRYLWVVQPGVGCCGEAYDAYVELVELATGRILLATSLPPEAPAVTATDDGLVLQSLRYVQTADGWVDEPGSHELLVLSSDGVLRSLGPGWALTATHGWVVVKDCRDDPQAAACDAHLIDLATGHHHEIARPAEGRWAPVAGPVVPIGSPAWSTASPTGVVLVGLVLADPDDPDRKPLESLLVAVPPDRPGEVEVLHRVDGGLPVAAWDRRGRHIVLFGDAFDHTNRDVTVIDPATGITTVLPDAIPADHSVLYVR